jgi:hypothetical protein
VEGKIVDTAQHNKVQRRAHKYAAIISYLVIELLVDIDDGGHDVCVDGVYVHAQHGPVGVFPEKENDINEEGEGGRKTGRECV